MTIPVRPCIECGRCTRTTTSRCAAHEREFQRRRNRVRVQYQGAWKRDSAAARRAVTHCPRCGVVLIKSKTARNGSTFDHETGRVECRSCNSSHRRDAT